MSDAQLIIGLVSIVLTFLGNLLRTERKQRRLTPAMNTAADMASLVVQAAEEVGKNMGFSGQEKYGYASLALGELAKRAGLTLSEAEVSVLVHAALGQKRLMDEAYADLRPTPPPDDPSNPAQLSLVTA